MSAIAVVWIFMHQSTVGPFEVPGGPCVKHVHGAYEYVDNEGEGAVVGSKAGAIGGKAGRSIHIHIMSVVFLLLYTYMLFARSRLCPGSGESWLPGRAASGIYVQCSQRLF